MIRPADANETGVAWRVAIEHKGAVALMLTRQVLPIIDRTKYASADGLEKGAYILADAKGKSPGTDSDCHRFRSGADSRSVREVKRRKALRRAW